VQGFTKSVQRPLGRRQLLRSVRCAPGKRDRNDTGARCAVVFRALTCPLAVIRAMMCRSDSTSTWSRGLAIRIVTTTLLLLLLAPAMAYAEIYKYMDRQGRLHFTDRPMKGQGYRLLWRSGTSGKGSSGSRIDTASFERNRNRFTPLIDEIARKVRLRPELLHAVIRAESAYDPRALSRAGAQGLMQLMPDTARRYGVQDSWDPRSNLTGGAAYLRDLLVMFEQDLRLALAAYNAGENAVRKYGNQIPPYPETRAYVTRVLDYYRENRSSGRFAAL